MANLINHGLDIHAQTAKALGSTRFEGKTTNFSVLYGIGVKSFAILLGVSEDKARVYLRKFWSTYPGFKRLSDHYEKRAQKDGYVTLITGRRRHFNDFSHAGHRTPHLRQAAYYKAPNSFIQGTVAEIIRRAIIRLDSIYKVNIVLQVHDSVLIEMPDDEKLLEKVKKVMLNPGIEEDLKDYHRNNPQWKKSWGVPTEFLCPLSIDITKGYRWGENE